MALDYWLRGDIPPGPIRAIVIMNVERVAEIIKKYKNSSTILLGSQITVLEDITSERIIEKFIDIANLINSYIITSNSKLIKRLDSLGFRKYKIMFPLEAIQKLASDQSIHEQLLILAGFRYTYGWLLLNALKHYKPGIRTLSLEPYAQPNATWTLPSLPLQVWTNRLSQLTKVLKSS